MENDKNVYRNELKADLAQMTKMLSSKGTTTVRIKNGVYDKVKIICDNENLSIVDYINSAIAEKIINDK